MSSANTALLSVAEALAMYCKRRSTETVEDLLGPAAVKAVLEAPTLTLPAPRHPLRALLSLGAIAVALGAIALPISAGVFMALVVAMGLVASIAGKPWIDHARDRFMNRHEPSRSDLVRLTGNAVQARNIHSLEEFRRQVGNGTLKAWSVSQSGSAKLLTGKDLACFVADHGRILFLSRDRNAWGAVRARPLPIGAICIELGWTIARTQLTAKSLIEEPDEEEYQRRAAWIRERAQERGKSSGALISGLAIIDALRHPEVRGQPFKKAMPTIRVVLKGPAASDSIIIKMRSANYAQFEKALHELPLEDLP